MYALVAVVAVAAASNVCLEVFQDSVRRATLMLLQVITLTHCDQACGTIAPGSYQVCSAATCAYYAPFRSV